jgi:hypothetical protein
MASDAMREAAEKKLRQLEGEGEEGGKPEGLHSLEAGKNAWRFLPIPGADKFYEEVNVHFGFGPPIRCLTTKFFGRNQNIPADGTACPICRMFNRKRAILNKKYAKGDAKGKELYGKMAREYRSSCNYYGPGFDPEAEEIRRKSTGPDPRNVEYTVARGEKRSDVLEVYSQVKGGIAGLLESVIPAARSAEEIEDFVKQMQVDMGDDEEEGGRERKRALRDEDDEDAKPKKPKCFGDADVRDPEDETCQECPFFKRCGKVIAAAEDESDDESEDEDEKPKKKASALDEVKAKLKAKAGGKRPPADESNEDEDDDE